jgi:hypothetical protein
MEAFSPRIYPDWLAPHDLTHGGRNCLELQLLAPNPHKRIPSSTIYSLTSSPINQEDNIDKRLNMPIILGGYTIMN